MKPVKLEANFPLFYCRNRKASFLAEANDFSFLKSFIQVMGALTMNAYRGSFPGVEQPEREADHSCPSSAKVKTECNYTLAPVYDFMACTVTT
jgi:hypothetical protein